MHPLLLLEAASGPPRGTSKHKLKGTTLGTVETTIVVVLRDVGLTVHDNRGVLHHCVFLDLNHA